MGWERQEKVFQTEVFKKRLSVWEFKQICFQEKRGGRERSDVIGELEKAQSMEG